MWIEWRHNTSLLGRAEGSGEKWRLGSGELFHLDGRSLRIMSAIQGRYPRKGRRGRIWAPVHRDTRSVFMIAAGTGIGRC